MKIRETSRFRRLTNLTEAPEEGEAIRLEEPPAFKGKEEEELERIKIEEG